VDELPVLEFDGFDDEDEVDDDVIKVVFPVAVVELGPATVSVLLLPASKLVGPVGNPGWVSWTLLTKPLA
jgi:hypothetical protein